MKKYDLISGGSPIALPIKDYRQLRAEAYQRGVFNTPGKFRFVFEEEAFQKGLEDDRHVKHDILGRQ